MENYWRDRPGHYRERVKSYFLACLDVGGVPFKEVAARSARGSQLTDKEIHYALMHWDKSYRNSFNAYSNGQRRVSALHELAASVSSPLGRSFLKAINFVPEYLALRAVHRSEDRMWEGAGEVLRMQFRGGSC